MEQLIIFLILLACGFFYGRWVENKHFDSILERERRLIHLPAINTRYPVGETGPIWQSKLAPGSVVISIDYFKRALANLKKFFGGKVTSYEPLLDRARREAILRMKESCLDANQIINLRIETSSISKGAGKSIGSVEVLAYGTALFTQQSPKPQEMVFTNSK